MSKRNYLPCQNCSIERRSYKPGLCWACLIAKGRARPSRVRELTQIEAAWLGAMIEGEGTMGAYDYGHRRLKGRIAVYNNSVETIATCLRLIGDGSVTLRGNLHKSPGAQQPQWVWQLQNRPSIIALLEQIHPYLTSKQEQAETVISRLMLPPIAGSSCHPTHYGKADTVHNSEEDIAKNWEAFRKADKVDPRAIRRQHHFKPGHGPHDDNPHDPWTTLEIKFEGEDPDPDQRDLLHGGPPVNMDCERCDTQLHAVGEMSMWEIYSQPGVEVANRVDIDSTRQKELEEQIVVILACPGCKKKYQFLKEFLPGEQSTAP